MKKYIFSFLTPLVILFVFLGFNVQSSYAVTCSAPASGNFTITTSCTFANTVDGVDGGSGAINTAAIILSGVWNSWAWGESTGWISLNCGNTSSCATSNYSVTNTNGTYSGYAWGERTGWISFNCSNTSSCGTVNYSVTDTNNVLSGYAWGERTGWISFNCSNTSSCGTVDYGASLSQTGATLTIGTVANQTIAFGSITISPGSSIVINKGVGAKLVKGSIWVADADGDGYPPTANPTPQVSATQPVGTTKRFLMTTLTQADCNDSNALYKKWFILMSSGFKAQCAY